MKKFIYMIFIAALFPIASCNNAENKQDDSLEAAEESNENVENTDMEEDADFAMQAADDGMLEVKLGELAQTNAGSAQIKDFGSSMVKDHGQANEELKAWANQKGVALPERLSNDNQDTYDKMAAKTGTDFDEAYTDLMVKSHKKTIRAFEKEAEKGNDMDLKTWAAEKLPTLKHHLQMAEEAESTADKNE